MGCFDLKKKMKNPSQDSAALAFGAIGCQPFKLHCCSGAPVGRHVMELCLATRRPSSTWRQKKNRTGHHAQKKLISQQRSPQNCWLLSFEGHKELGCSVTSRNDEETTWSARRTWSLIHVHQVDYFHYLIHVDSPGLQRYREKNSTNLWRDLGKQPNLASCLHHGI